MIKNNEVYKETRRAITYTPDFEFAVQRIFDAMGAGAGIMWLENGSVQLKSRKGIVVKLVKDSEGFVEKAIYQAGKDYKEFVKED